MRTIIRLFFVLAVLAVGAYMLGYVGPFWRPASDPAAPSVGTTGAIDVQKARQRGAELGEKAAVAAEKVRDSARDAAITAKIKAKMTLDDLVKARSIDVSTDGSTVVVSGTVGSVAEHDRAIALARETDGVAQVIDRLAIKRK
jgi:osmotically-inducible protein OsmY